MNSNGVSAELYKPAERYKHDELYESAEHYKADETYVTKELYNKIQPLTKNMATKVMMFASTMIAAASAT